MKLLLTCGGQAGVGASWSEASTAGGMGVAVVWQPGMSKMDHDELQELRGGGEGRAASGEEPVLCQRVAVPVVQSTRHQVANIEQRDFFFLGELRVIIKELQLAVRCSEGQK